MRGGECLHQAFGVSTRGHGHEGAGAGRGKRAASRGMVLRADQITVTNGCTEALTLALRALGFLAAEPERLPQG